MVYLLIDTCSLRDLLDVHGYSTYLTELKSLIANDSIQWLSHEKVVEEWNKHKEKWGRRKLAKILPVHQEMETSHNSKQHIVKYEKSYIETQIGDIDNLIGSNRILKTPEIISNEFAGRYSKGLAPFHKKKDSLNDWEIIGSLAHYCQVNGIDEVYFISSNNTDFGDENSEDIKIHPDLKERFSSVNIKYFQELPEFFNHMSNGLSRSPDLIRYTLPSNPKFTTKTTYRKNILDSLCSIFKELYEELNFIPLHILIKYYPFSEIEGKEAYYNRFSIRTFSKETHSFFCNIEISESSFSFIDESLIANVKNPHDKTDFILRRLNENLIFNISGNVGAGTQQKNIRYNFENDCQCYKCLFEEFKISESLKLLREEKIEVKDKLAQAYIHVKLGNYNSANTLYKEVAQIALEQKKYISYFIAKYNQKHLGKFMKWSLLWNASNSREDFDIENIDILEEAVKLKPFTDYALLVYICENDFFNYPFQHAHEVLNDIVAHYDTQLYGGWSSNDHVWDLIDTFVRVELFLKANNIIYDQYSNFTKLFLLVVDGLFASHTISKSQHSRFIHFDDFWISRFIRYGHAEKVRKIASKYSLQTIKYNEGDDNKHRYLDALLNLMQSKRTLMEEPSLYIDEGNDTVLEDIETYITNAINIIAYLDLDTDKVNSVGQTIYELIKMGMNDRYPFSKTLSFFFNKKGKLFEPRLKISFFEYFVHSSLECDRGILESLIVILDKRDVKLISQKMLGQFINKHFDKCSSCEKKHDIVALLELYGLLGVKAQKDISKRVLTEYRATQDFNLFYMAVMYEVIPVSVLELIGFVEGFKVPAKKNGEQRGFFDDPYLPRNSYADRVINMCFKFNIDTTTSNFKKFSKIHPYYKWLLNMESFEYRYFNPEWVLLHKTTYYHRAMSKSPKLIAALKEYLTKKRHPGIEFVLLEIACFMQTGN